MCIALAGAGFDAFFVDSASPVNIAKLLQRLSAVIIRSGIVFVQFQDSAVFFDSLFQISAIGELHRKAITREGVFGVLHYHLFQNVEPVGCHKPLFWHRIGSLPLGRPDALIIGEYALPIV